MFNLLGGHNSFVGTGCFNFEPQNWRLALLLGVLFLNNTFVSTAPGGPTPAIENRNSPGVKFSTKEWVGQFLPSKKQSRDKNV